MMNIIGINTGEVEKSVKLFKKYIETLSNPEKAVYARIRYNVRHLIPPSATPLKWPLVIYTTDGFAFCIADVSAGYSGKAPLGTIEILEHLGFEFDIDDIIQPREVTKLDILKEGYSLDINFKTYKFPKECADILPVTIKQDS